MPDFPVTLFHNPSCGTSRKVLEALRDEGHDPEVVEYLKMGWTVRRLRGLLDRMGEDPRALLREKEAEAAELGLLDPGVSDDALLAAMAAHPVLVNRPIVETPLGAVLARPAGRLAEVLPPRPAARRDPTPGVSS